MPGGKEGYNSSLGSERMREMGEDLRGEGGGEISVSLCGRETGRRGEWMMHREKEKGKGKGD